MRTLLSLLIALAWLGGCGGSSSDADAGANVPGLRDGDAGRGSSDGGDGAAMTRDFALGFTPWPYAATQEAVSFVNSEISERGDFVAHHIDSGIPWQEALEGVAYPSEVEANLRARLESTPRAQRQYVALSPFNSARDGLAGYWSAGTNEPLPAVWAARELDSPEVIEAYTRFALDIVGRFEPKWFNLGVEASELILNDLARYQRFVVFAEQVAGALKAKFPNTKTMISVALKSPGSNEAALIETHLPSALAHVEVLGISAYPYVFFSHTDKGDPASLPANWLSQVKAFSGDKPIAIAETGWIAEPLQITEFGVDVPANAEQQADYVRALFGEADALDAQFIVWFALVDFDELWAETLARDPIAHIWRDTGLFDEELRPRPALDVWQAQLALPLK